MADKRLECEYMVGVQFMVSSTMALVPIGSVQLRSVVKAYRGSWTNLAFINGAFFYSTSTFYSVFN